MFHPDDPICTDNFGTSVYRCWMTNVLVWADNALIVGAIVPGVKAKHVISPGAIENYRQSGRLFHESERNCNTCFWLSRVKHDRNKWGFLFGKCTNPKGRPELSPYKSEQLMFHPDDPMHMPCYKSRWGN